MKVILHSLRTRLLLMTIVVLMIAIGAVSFFSGRATKSEFRRYVASDAMTDIESAMEPVKGHYLRHGSWEDVDPILEQVGKTANRQLILIDSERRIVATSGGALSKAQIEITPDHSVMMKFRETDNPGEAGKPGLSPPALMKVAAMFDVPHVQLQGARNEPVGVLYVLPVSLRNSMLNQAVFDSSVNRSLLLAGLLAMGVALVVTAVLSQRILGPVGALTAAVRRMENGNLNQRLSVKSHDEIGDLTRAFNSMSDSLVRVENLRRNAVNDIAHELRTPLTNIRCHLEMLQDGLVEPSPRVLDSLYEETMLLSRIIDDLQDLALAESRQLSMYLQPMSIREEIVLAVNTLEPQASAREITLKTEVASDLPPAYADPKRIGQILRNLLNNALTNTPAGGSIEVRALATDAEIEVTVQDTGDGIAPEHVDNVFERFYRTDLSRERATGGAGLGLAIVKQFVNLHGGRIRVSSTLGKGSAFVFTLPRLPSQIKHSN